MKILKKILAVLFLIMGTVIVSSCSDDNDEPKNNTILGIWSYIVTNNVLYGKNEVDIV